MPEDSIVPNGGAHGGQEASHAPDAPGYLALKLLFFTPKRGDVAGGACTIYEGATGETILQTFCLTRSVPSLGFKPTEGWRTFNKLVSKIGPYDRTWGDKIEAILPDLFPDEDRIALFDEARSSSPSKEVLSRVEGKVPTAKGPVTVRVEGGVLTVDVPAPARVEWAGKVHDVAAGRHVVPAK